MTTDYEAMKQAVDDYLVEIGVKFSVVNAGVRYEAAARNERLHEMDAWRVTLDKVGTYAKPVAKSAPTLYSDLYTGIGHRSKPTPYSGPPLAVNMLAWEAWQATRKPVAPRAADVLHSLLLDGAAADMSFYDWARDYAYDSDSIKAFNTYTACCETGRQMRQLFSHDEHAKLQELVQDL